MYTVLSAFLWPLEGDRCDIWAKSASNGIALNKNVVLKEANRVLLQASMGFMVVIFERYNFIPHKVKALETKNDRFPGAKK